MNPLRVCGHCLLWIGILLGAFVSVRQTEIAEQPWSTISWPAYIGSLAIAIVGVILLRMTARAARQESGHHDGDVAEMNEILQRVQERLEDWKKDLPLESVHDIHRRIDADVSDDLARFAELRTTLIDVFGLDRYAQIMTEFALSERTINRMWSASADGYVDEVQACLERAIRHLESARQKLRTAGESPYASAAV